MVISDLAVLSKDDLSVPVEEIGGIQSLLTLAGGRVVYADEPFAPLEERRRSGSMRCSGASNAMSS